VPKKPELFKIDATLDELTKHMLNSNITTKDKCQPQAKETPITQQKETIKDENMVSKNK
jgi:hypothetical protein